MNVVILYYDCEDAAETIYNRIEDIKKTFGEDTTFLAMPKNYDILLNCSIDQLQAARDMISKAIMQKAQEKK